MIPRDTASPDPSAERGDRLDLGGYLQKGVQILQLDLVTVDEVARDEDFWFAGQGITITFKGADDRPPLVGIDFAEEGVFDSQGKWIPGRRLNGDQTHQGRHIRLPPGKPQIQKVRFYRYR